MVKIVIPIVLEESEDEEIALFLRNLKTSPSSVGSGVYVSKNKILTCSHVVGGADKVEIIYSNGKRGEASVVAKSKWLDLALLESEPNTFSPISLEKPGFGDNVWTIGSPLEMSFSLSKGIVSHPRRVINSILGPAVFIQSDVAIAPGSSGGPLFNESGEMIGIVASVYWGTRGISFSIPAESIAFFLKNIDSDIIHRPSTIGITLSENAVVTSSRRSDFLEGDKILSINGQKVFNSEDVASILFLNFGKSNFKVLRENEEVDIEVEIAGI